MQEKSEKKFILLVGGLVIHNKQSFPRLAKPSYYSFQ